MRRVVLVRRVVPVPSEEGGFGEEVGGSTVPVPSEEGGMEVGESTVPVPILSLFNCLVKSAVFVA